MIWGILFRKPRICPNQLVGNVPFVDRRAGHLSMHRNRNAIPVGPSISLDQFSSYLCRFTYIAENNTGTVTITEFPEYQRVVIDHEAILLKQEQIRITVSMLEWQ